MAIDKDALREHVRGLLIALGDDPDREGLKEHRTAWHGCMRKYLRV